jgi:hypothetical protein
MGFAEPVSSKEVLDELKQRFEKKVKKARLVGDVEYEETAREVYETDVELIKKLEDLELYVVKTEGLDSCYFSHPVKRYYEKAYALCVKLSPPLQFTSYNGENYANTRIRVFGGQLMVYLGERNPFIPLQTQHFKPFETTVGELRRLAVVEINPYAERLLKEYGVELELFALPAEDDLKAVFSFTGSTNPEYSLATWVGHISDYHYVEFELTEKEKRERMLSIQMFRDKKREENERLKTLVREGELISPASASAELYKIRPETVAKISEKVAEIADEAYLLLCNTFPEHKSISPNMPLHTINAYKWLEVAGVTARILPPPRLWSVFNTVYLKGIEPYLKGYYLTIDLGYIVEGECYRYLFLLFKPKKKLPMSVETTNMALMGY